MNQAATVLLDQVLGIWREVLECDSAELRADSNFFLNGGDSLQLTRVLVRIRERLGVELDVRDAVRFSTPEKMARCCVSASSRLAWNARPRQSGGVTVSPGADCYRCTDGQAALWLAEQLGGASGVYNTAVVLRLTGGLQIDALARALTLLLHQHEVLRTRFQFDVRQQQLLARVAPPQNVALHVVAMSQAAATRYLHELAARPFDFGGEWLWRFCLIETGPRAWSLLLCLHHCITDGWSGSVLLRQLSHAYDALLRDPGWQPAGADCEYRAYALQQPHLAETALCWWREYLAGADSLVSWPPTGNRRWPFSMSCEQETLSMQDIGRVQAMLHDTDARMSALLLTAVRLAIRSLTGVDELCIGMPANVRTTSAQESSIGYFVNLLVTRDRVDPGMGGLEALRKVQRSLGDALSHRMVSFPVLARLLKPAPLPSGNPWCDVLFAFQNVPFTQPAFAGLKCELEALTMPYGQHPLKVEFLCTPGEWICRMEYAGEVLTQTDIRKLLCGIRYQIAALAGMLERRS